MNDAIPEVKVGDGLLGLNLSALLAGLENEGRLTRDESLYIAKAVVAAKTVPPCGWEVVEEAQQWARAGAECKRCGYALSEGVYLSDGVDALRGKTP
jgi:hypothetical protein